MKREEKKRNQANTARRKPHSVEGENDLIRKSMYELLNDNKRLQKENASLEEKNASLEEKIEKLERSSKSLRAERDILNTKYEEQKKILEDILPKQYLDLQGRLHEIKACKPYEDFFEQNVLSLQKLLGFADIADTLTEEKQEYYMWEVIGGPMLKTVRKMGGEIKRGMLFLPEKMGAFDREKTKENIKGEALTELARYIREDELGERQGKIALQKKAVVQELGNLIAELEGMDRNLPVDGEEIKRLAQEAQMVLEENGIYPMFANDSRLEEDRALQERFSPLNAYSIRYPGLYIERESAWEVLGSHIGMDSIEEEASED